MRSAAALPVNQFYLKSTGRFSAVRFREPGHGRNWTYDAGWQGTCLALKYSGRRTSEWCMRSAAALPVNQFDLRSTGRSSTVRCRAPCHSGRHLSYKGQLTYGEMFWQVHLGVVPRSATGWTPSSTCTRQSGHDCLIPGHDCLILGTTVLFPGTTVLIWARLSYSGPNHAGEPRGGARVLQLDGHQVPPAPGTPKPNPYTLNPKLLHKEPYTFNPRPYTMRPTPKILNPKP